ncbi:hypothetical protein [Bradyrhizobium sp. 18]|uniref:hypothetical protein n=1 Tax=Bradyrhizobium sp. 18 TaxID=2782657 RepID=UPI001FF7480D|nr:hypothetical protein [Bradyrhizobium sp. 18]MCK1507555.1 hypothetical protein [Bradyrhizobium sp. 18]
MTHKIIKSSLALFTFTPEEQKRGIVDFQSAVDAYSAELTHWLDREAKMAAQGPLPPKPEWGEVEPENYSRALRAWEAKALEQIHPIPKPVAHPDIVAAVNGQGYVDFEVVNDDPTDEEVLRGKKNELLSRIHRAELAAIDQALPPPGKRRLANLLETDIHAADNELRKTMLAEPIPQLDGSISNRSPASIEKSVALIRKKHHTQHLADQESRRAKVDVIVRAAAQAMSDVEDLTADNIEAFRIPSLN